MTSPRGLKQKEVVEMAEPWRPQTEEEYRRDQEQRFLGHAGIDRFYLESLNRRWSRLGKLVRNGSLK